LRKKVKADLGPDAERVTNAAGGMQSKLEHDFTLTDPVANFKLAEVLTIGKERYAKDNWRLISVESHLNHLLNHINAYLAGDTQDDHLGHALCRAHMAVAKAERPNFYGEVADKAKKAGLKVDK
jgi:hypothetical protein